MEIDRGLVFSEGIPRRLRRPRTDLARAATIYARAPRASRRDRVRAVAAEIPCSERTAYRLIGDARNLEYLDGDALTDNVQQILDRDHSARSHSC